MTCEARPKIFRFLWWLHIFQKHAPLYIKVKLHFFQVCIILPCFVHTEYYLVVILKRYYIKEAAQLWNFKKRGYEY